MLTVKLAELVPAARVSLAGTIALVGLLLESVTAIPPNGAGPLRLTVPVEAEPPTIVEGFSVSDNSAGGFTASVAVLTVPL